jgi:hypothetical protein
MLRITPRNVKTFSVIYRVVGEGGTSSTGRLLAGKQHRITLGATPPLELTNARRLAREIIQAASEGRDLRVVREVLAAGDQGCADYILRWAAWALQNPAEPAEAALVFKGGQGTGKSTFGRAMTRLSDNTDCRFPPPGSLRAGSILTCGTFVCYLLMKPCVQMTSQVEVH